jgi:hypothetical protein
MVGLLVFNARRMKPDRESRCRMAQAYRGGSLPVAP